MSRPSHPQRALVAGMALTTMLVGACAPVGPNYKRPELAPPTTFRGAAPAAGPESLADMPWWLVFEDPALQGLLRDAVANNLDLRLAVSRRDWAREGPPMPGMTTSVTRTSIRDKPAATSNASAPPPFQHQQLSPSPVLDPQIDLAPEFVEVVRR